MDNGINNLEALTDQIYQEGVEKADKRAIEILQKAEADSEQILMEARKDALNITTESKREMERLQQTIEHQLELKGKQFLSDLKAKIETLLCDKIVVASTKAAFVDVEFMKSVIMEMVKHWQPDQELELEIPTALKNRLFESFAASIIESVPNLSIEFKDHVNGGFRIAKKQDNYQIAFSEEDFVETFRGYLTEVTNQLLFRSRQ